MRVAAFVFIALVAVIVFANNGGVLRYLVGRFL